MLNCLSENIQLQARHENKVPTNDVKDKPNLDGKKHQSLDKLIASFFFSRYKLVVASDSKEKKVGYETRHQVYCEEMRYEAENERALEQDAYDKRAISCHIQHLPTGKCAGTIRLVLPKLNGEGLPVEDKFSDIFEDPSLLPSREADHGVCEISRLAIPKDFRVRQFRSKILSSRAEVASNKSNVNIDQLPYLSIALYLMATSICIKHDLRFAYVLMEPKLARRMKAFGIDFKDIGSSVEFNGKRVPYRIDPKVLVSELAKPLRGFYRSIDKALENETQAAFDQIQPNQLEVDDIQHNEYMAQNSTKNNSANASLGIIKAA